MTTGSLVTERFRINNFDLIRLVAALQVVLGHASTHLGVEFGSFVIWAVKVFPGVPVFFFVSGFLISKSYENNLVKKEYAQNRILRIYPALIVCTFVTIISVGLSGYFSREGTSFSSIAALVLGQTTFFQFYNPDFMRSFGTGVLNGSLWTITVELQFYVLIPVLYWVLGMGSRSATIRLVLMILFFAGVNFFFNGIGHAYQNELFYKLCRTSFVPWFYMFLVGVFFQKKFLFFDKHLRDRFWVILTLYLVTIFFMTTRLGWGLGNTLSFPIYLMLALLVFSAAYSIPFLSGRLLRGDDISYGVYIYHIPVINLFIYYGFVGKPVFIGAVVVLTVMVAAASWILVEKPSLKLKNHPLNPLRKDKNSSQALRSVPSKGA